MKNTNKTALKKMLKVVREKDKSLYWICAAYTFFAVCAPLFPVLLPKLLLTELTSATPLIRNVIYITAGYLAIAGLFGFVKTQLELHNYPRITALRMDYLTEMSLKLMSCEYKYVEDSTFYEKNAYALESTSNNSNGVEGVYHKLFVIPATAIILLVLCIFIGIKSPIILVALILHAVVTTLLANASQKFEHAHISEETKANRRIQYYYGVSQDFSYGKDTRIYGLKDRICNNFKAEINAYITVIKKIQNREFAFGFLALLTLLVSDLCTYGLLVYFVAAKGMSIADFSMYLTAVITLSATSTIFSTDLSIVLRELLYVVDFFNFIEADYGEKGGALPTVAQDDTLEIEFRDVTFTYPNMDKPVFSHLNFVIPKGQKLAIVGINGAGKTTLVKLMTGLFKVDSGEILINGKNVNDYSTDAMRQMFSVVFQDVSILAFTVAENIACTSGDAIDRDKVATVIETVGLKEKVDSLPHGIDTFLLKTIDEEGAELSGGQKQLVAIARALYKGSNAVIMDEPTSALDALAEAKIYEDFSELVENKTAIYISHRLASTKFCDKIALFDGSGIAEYGSHDELMSLGKNYFEMFETQGKYYRENKGGDAE